MSRHATAGQDRRVTAGQDRRVTAGWDRCVVVGGGAVGALFGDLLARSWDVVVVDRTPGPGRVVGDLTAIDDALAARLGAAHAVVLAVPEPVAVAAVPALAAAMPSGALLVDTLSVKSRYARAIAATRPDLEVLGVNPMFAPSLPASGRPVATVELRGGPRGSRFLDLLTEAGVRLVPVTADRHDRLTSAAQALTHATVLSFGSALTQLDVTVEELAAVAPPPHATLLALLARIAAGTPEVYWDVQAANPFAEHARAALCAGAATVHAAVGEGEGEFTRLLAAMRSVLGQQLDPLTDDCARVFAHT
ncbi:MAG: hypothetical protein ACRC35_13500 [Angustibacter sp.]